MPMGMWPVGVLISVGCHTATSPTFIQKRKNKKIKNKKMSATIDQVVYYISRTWNIITITTIIIILIILILLLIIIILDTLENGSELASQFPQKMNMNDRLLCV
jgi:ABC-type Fe3+-siderophore transport system permease subunit